MAAQRGIEETFLNHFFSCYLSLLMTLGKNASSLVLHLIAEKSRIGTFMYGKHLPIRLADDPGDPVWQWFIFNGPHGERFAWHKELAVAPRDLEYLARFIDERTETDAKFPAKARAVALHALEMDNAVLKRTAIQVLCVVGSDDDMNQVQQLLEHPDADIAKDARCCLFERGIKPHHKA